MLLPIISGNLLSSETDQIQATKTTKANVADVIGLITAIITKIMETNSVCDRLKPNLKLNCLTSAISQFGVSYRGKELWEISEVTRGRLYINCYDRGLICTGRMGIIRN